MTKYHFSKAREALHRPALLASIICFWALLPGTIEAQTIRPCAPPDSITANLTRFAAQILSDTTAGARSFRTKFGVPTGTAADVSIVQDNTVCDAATAGGEAAGV